MTKKGDLGLKIRERFCFLFKEGESFSIVKVDFQIKK